MNIQTVAGNLRNTIAGKQTMLDRLIQRQAVKREFHDEVAYFATKEFLEINIDELKRILQDVEQCCEKATYDSWRENPDRMGGQFTQEEINRGSEWR